MKTADAIDHFDYDGRGVYRLAVALDITPAAVYRWGDTIPRARAYQLQVLTDGALKCERPSKRGAAA